MDYKKRVKWGIVISLVLLFIFIYTFYNPQDYLFFPKCPFKELTGYECPGCGSQRAIHSLLNLNVSNAFRENALLVIAIPYLVLGFIFDLAKNSSSRWLKWRRILFGEKAIYIILIMILGYWLLRNIF